MNEVGKFMEALRDDPRAKELMNSIDVPDEEEKGVDAYLELAKKLGFSISREDLLSWKQEKEKECVSRFEKAEASMMEAMDPEEMSMAAGGKGDIRSVKVHSIKGSGAGSRTPASMSSTVIIAIQSLIKFRADERGRGGVNPAASPQAGLNRMPGL